MFKNFKIQSGPLILSSVVDVHEAEKQLNIIFPTGYKEYVTQFGQGVLGGSYVRIYPPYRIVSELKDWRERIAEYWFWDDGRESLTQEQALESIIIGDTMDGDELVVHPSSPELIYVLPRYQEAMFIAGNGLPSAIEWLCSSGVLTKAFEERNFEPFS